MGPVGGAGGAGFGFVWGVLGVLLSVVLLAAAVYLLARHLGESPTPPRTADPTTVLERRYARGEIDDAEFAERRAKLTDRTQS